MNRSIKENRKLFTHRIGLIRLVLNEMRSRKFYGILLVSVMTVGILSLSSVTSSLIKAVSIGSTGNISTRENAASGSAKDIQAAVDFVASTGGGNVYIPEGTFNFYEPEETWEPVVVPVGVNIFGAPTERTSGQPEPSRGMSSNNQVVEWRTVLIMPYEAPTAGGDDRPEWFRIEGNGDPERSFRFSDIKLVGWRYFDNSSTTVYTGILIDDVLDFRVDHSCFQDIAGSAIWAGSEPARDYNHGVVSGVIDHNIFKNTYGDPGFMSYPGTLGYGIGMRRWACDLWDSDISNIIGHYNNYTIFIEDNYFSKWRHSVCSNDGLHYVFCHNTIEGDYGIGSIDAHGSYAEDNHPYAVGTRAIEVYENEFLNPDKTWHPQPWAINFRGGGGAIFNNTIEGYYGLVEINDDYGNIHYVPKCHTNNLYIWGNTLGEGVNLFSMIYDSEENVHYFLRAPNLGQDGFEYTPVPYPHPLILE